MNIKDLIVGQELYCFESEKNTHYIGIVADNIEYPGKICVSWYYVKSGTNEPYEGAFCDYTEPEWIEICEFSVVKTLSETEKLALLLRLS